MASSATWRSALVGAAMVTAQNGENGDPVRVREDFVRGWEIIARLAAAAPDNATLPRDLAWFEAQIAALGQAA